MPERGVARNGYPQDRPRRSPESGTWGLRPLSLGGGLL